MLSIEVPTWATHIFAIIVAAFGLACFIFGAPLAHDDEQNRARNRVLDWWVRIESINERSLPTSVRFANRMSAAASRVIDWVFGKRQFSARFMWTALLLFHAGLVVLWVLRLQSPKAANYFYWFFRDEVRGWIYEYGARRAFTAFDWWSIFYVGAGLAALAFVPALFRGWPAKEPWRKWLRKAIRMNVAAFVVAATCGYSIFCMAAVFYYFTRDYVSHGMAVVIPWVFGAWVAALVLDVVLLVLIRAFLARAQQPCGTALGFLASSMALPIVALVVPVLVSWFGYGHAAADHRYGWGTIRIAVAENALLFVPMDLIGICITVVLGAAAIVLVLNVAAWPLFSRLLFALHNRFNDRKVWAGAGVLLLTAAWKMW